MTETADAYLSLPYVNIPCRTQFDKMTPETRYCIFQAFEMALHEVKRIRDGGWGRVAYLCFILGDLHYQHKKITADTLSLCEGILRDHLQGYAAFEGLMAVTCEAYQQDWVNVHTHTLRQRMYATRIQFIENLMEKAQ